MADISELELRNRELELKQHELELELSKLSIEFAKYGFAGTLTAGLVGMALLLCLAALSAFTEFEIDTWGLVSIGFIVLLGTIAFGFFSLRQLPTLVARFQGLDLSVNPDTRTAAGGHN